MAAISAFRSQSFLPDDISLIRTLISAKKDFRSSRAALRNVEALSYKFKVCNKNTTFVILKESKLSYRD